MIRRRYLPFLAWLLVFYAAWTVLVVFGEHWEAVRAHWPMAAAMALGSYVAGSTPMGGGTVGFPVLVLQNLGTDLIPFWHYAAVVGYDLEREEVVLRSGERDRLVRPFSNFERTWQRADHWAVVVTKPQELPTFINEQAFMRAVLLLESLA